MTERGTVDGVGDALGNTLNTTAEAVVVTVVVVIAHVTLELGGVDSAGRSSFSYTNLSLGAREVGSRSTEAGAFLTIRLLTDAEALLSGRGLDGTGLLTVLAFSNVKSGVEASGSDTDTTDGIEVTVVGGITYFELGVDVLLIRGLITDEKSQSSWRRMKRMGTWEGKEERKVREGEKVKKNMEQQQQLWTATGEVTDRQGPMGRD